MDEAGSDHSIRHVGALRIAPVEPARLDQLVGGIIERASQYGPFPCGLADVGQVRVLDASRDAGSAQIGDPPLWAVSVWAKPRRQVWYMERPR